MKKLYYLLVLVLISTFTFASDLFLRVNRNQEVVVELNNQKQTNKTNNFQFFNISTGNAFLKVYDRWNGFIVFQGNITIPHNTQVNAEIDPYGNFRIINSVPYANYPNNGGYNQGYGTNYPKGYGGKKKGKYGNYGNNTNQQYFNQFLQIIRNESFDNNRLKTAKQYAMQNKLYAEQIAQIAATFSFDSNRLDFAKAAYNNCIDKGNYFLLQPTFSFSSNYNNLMKWIGY